MPYSLVAYRGRRQCSKQARLSQTYVPLYFYVDFETTSRAPPFLWMTSRSPDIQRHAQERRREFDGLASGRGGVYGGDDGVRCQHPV